MVNFGTKLIEVRKAKGLTQNEVAEKCKITVRTIQRIESGQVQPRAFTIKVISESLGFDFFKDTEIKNNDVVKDDLKLNKNTTLWYLKDLFNFKTNAMKKVTILTLFCLTIGLTLFAFKRADNDEYSNKNVLESKNQIIPGFAVADHFLQVAFTNNLNIEDLMLIKESLKAKGVSIAYKKLEFDKNNQLLSIDYSIDCNNVHQGNYSAKDLKNTNNKQGFYFDYSQKLEPTFGVGLLKKIIVIDAGHGGKDPGRITGDFKEKDFNLKMAIKLKELYKSKDTEIFLTRDSDEFIDLWHRAKIINSLNPEMMISLHFNEREDRNLKGFNCYINRGENNTESEKIAKKILSHQDNLSNKPIRKAGFVILKNVKCPAVLIEMGFLSNKDDRALLTSEKGQLKIVKGIIKAIE